MSNRIKYSIVGGLVSEKTLPPSHPQLTEFADRYHQLYKEFGNVELSNLAAFSEMEEANDYLLSTSKLGHKRSENIFKDYLFKIIPNEFLNRYLWDNIAIFCKSRPIYAFFSQDACFLTAPFFHYLSKRELIQLAIHGQTIAVGLEAPCDLNLTSSELVLTIDYLAELNKKQPGWGISEYQKYSLLRAYDNTGGSSGLNVNSLLASLDIAPDIAQPVKLNALDFLGRLRRKKFHYPDKEDTQAFDSLNFLTKKLEPKLVPLKKVKITLVSFGSPWHYALWNNLSVETLAGDLIGEYGDGVEITIERAVLDEEVDRLVENLHQRNPDILGLSIELGTLKLVDRFFQRFNESSWEKAPLLALGNQVPTYFPEKFIDSAKGMKTVVCLHEGEYVMRGLVDHVRGLKDLKEINNLLFRDTQTGRIVRTPLINQDLSTLPHPPSLDTVRKGITNMIQTSRGCVFSCSFCTRWQNWNAGKKLEAEGMIVEPEANLKWRAFDLARVFENIERFVASGINEIEFCDDEFFGGYSDARLKRVSDFAEGLIKIRKKYNKDITYRLFTTPLIIYRDRNTPKAREKNKEIRNLLIKLKESGLVRIYIGLESGDMKQKKRYNRTETMEETIGALNVLRELDFEIDIGFIMFDPELTVKEMMENIAFFRKHDLVRHNTWPFRPLVVNEGTAIKRRLEKSGLLTGDQDPDFLSYEYRFSDPVVGKIHSTVQEIAQETAPVFYTLKTISKSHWNGQKNRETEFSLRMATENAMIYLDLMEALGKELNTAQDAIPLDLIDSTRFRILRLILEVENKIVSGFFDSYQYDKEALVRHIKHFKNNYRKTYQAIPIGNF